MRSAHSSDCWGERASPEFGTANCVPWPPCDDRASDQDVREMVPEMPDDASIFRVGGPTPDGSIEDAMAVEGDVIVAVFEDLTIPSSRVWRGSLAIVAPGCTPVTVTSNGLPGRERLYVSGLRMRVTDEAFDRLTHVSFTNAEIEWDSSELLTTGTLVLSGVEWRVTGSLFAGVGSHAFLTDVFFSGEVEAPTILGFDTPTFDIRRVAFHTVQPNRGLTLDTSMVFLGEVRIDEFYIDNAPNGGLEVGSDEATIHNVHIRSPSPDPGALPALWLRGTTGSIRGVHLDGVGQGLKATHDASALLEEVVVRLSEQTTESATAFDLSAPVVVIRATAMGAHGPAIHVGADVELHDIDVISTRTATNDSAIDVASEDGDGLDVLLARVRVREADGGALAIGNATVTARDLTFTDIMREDRGHTSIDVGPESVLTADRLTLSGAAHAAALSARGTVLLTDFYASDLDAGSARAPFAWITASNSNRLELRRARFENYSHAAVSAVDVGTVVLEDAEFAASADGLSLTYGLVTDGAGVEMARATFTGISGVALHVEDSELTAQDVLIADAGDNFAELSGRGMQLSSGTRATLERVQLYGLRSAGLVAGFSSLTAEDLWIRGVSDTGDGLVFQSGELRLTDVAVGSVDGVGFSYYDARTPLFVNVSVLGGGVGVAGPAAAAAIQNGEISVAGSVEVESRNEPVVPVFLDPLRPGSL